MKLTKSYHHSYHGHQWTRKSIHPLAGEQTKTIVKANCSLFSNWFLKQRAFPHKKAYTTHPQNKTQTLVKKYVTLCLNPTWFILSVRHFFLLCSSMPPHTHFQNLPPITQNLPLFSPQATLSHKIHKENSLCSYCKGQIVPFGRIFWSFPCLSAV